MSTKDENHWNGFRTEMAEVERAYHYAWLNAQALCRTPEEEEKVLVGLDGVKTALRAWQEVVRSIQDRPLSELSPPVEQGPARVP